MEAITLKRVFKYDKLMLPDPDRKLTPAQVLDYYANVYPELTTGVVNGPEIENDCEVFDFNNEFKPHG